MVGPPGERFFRLRWVALDRRVIIVAVESNPTKIESNAINHGAYIGAVKGEDHDEEALKVVACGSRVPTRLAEVYFKDIARGPGKPLFGSDTYSSFEWFETKIRRQRENPSPWPLESGILGVNPIDKHVLIVAAKRPGDRNIWGAYIGAVEGEDYDEEAVDVVTHGSELPYEVAEACFEDLARDPNWKWHDELRASFD